MGEAKKNQPWPLPLGAHRAAGGVKDTANPARQLSPQEQKEAALKKTRLCAGGAVGSVTYLDLIALLGRVPAQDFLWEFMGTPEGSVESGRAHMPG